MADETVEERVEQTEEEEGGPVKSFLEHLEDLRWVLIKSLVALGLGMLVCLIAGPTVVEVLKRPLEKARVSYPGTNHIVTLLFGTNQLAVYPMTMAEEQAAKERAVDLGTNRFVAVRLEPATIGTNQVLTWQIDHNPAVAQKAQGLMVEIINLGPAAGFFVAFQVAFYGGIVLAAPFIFYFIASFIFPALKMTEKYYVYRGLGFGVSLFMVGVAFCYFALMPLALAASQAYSKWLGFSAYQWRAEEYISFVSKFMLGMGLGFEMPVVVLTLVKIGVLNYTILAKGRRYMIVINLVLGGLLTTPEVITQIIMFVPLQLLYEISIWIAWYWERQDKKRAAAAAAVAPSA